MTVQVEGTSSFLLASVCAEFVHSVMCSVYVGTVFMSSHADDDYVCNVIFQVVTI